MRVQDAFVGIDVAFAKKKVLPICIVTWQADRLIPFSLRDLPATPPRGHGNVAALDPDVVRGFADDTARYLAEVSEMLGVRLARIGIDAPSAPSGHGQRRAAERALDAAGISCFATPSFEQFVSIREKIARHLSSGGAVDRLPHANQLWMLVGFALFQRLGEVAPCLEVFPQATARAIGSGAIHKFKRGGPEAQLEAAATHTRWPRSPEDQGGLKRISWGPLHDCVDAYLSAWVAALDEKSRTAYGDPPHDAIWVPRIDQHAAPDPPVRPLSPSSGPTAHATLSLSDPMRGRSEPTEREFAGSVSPTIFRFQGLRFFFFSREEERVHIHVRGPEGEAKVWMEPRIELVRAHGLRDEQVAMVLRVIEERQDEIRRAWRRHFGR